MKKENKGNRPLFLRLITGWIPEKKPALDKSKKYVFIVSTGRTGTTYIANYLANYKNVYSVHEPKPTWRLRMWSIANLESNIDDDYLYKVFAKLRKEYIDKVEEKIYIESNPALKGFSAAIAKNVPNSYIIHIVRDPRDSVSSGINHGALRFKKRIMISLLPYWHLHPLKLLNQKRSVIDKIARSWVLTNAHIKESEEYTSNYMRIRFEDLFSDENKMKELTSFIGIGQAYIEETRTNSSQKSRNASKFNDINKWRDWSPSLAKQVYSITGESMEKYGYGQESEWRNKINRSLD